MTNSSQAKAIAQDQNLTEEAELANGRFAMIGIIAALGAYLTTCLLYTSPSPRDGLLSRMPSSA